MECAWECWEYWKWSRDSEGLYVCMGVWGLQGKVYSMLGRVDGGGKKVMVVGGWGRDRHWNVHLPFRKRGHFR